MGWAVSDGMTLTTFGGIDASGATVGKIWKLNLQTHEWASQLYRSNRFIRRGAVVSMVGPGRFIVIGGDDTTSWALQQPAAPNLLIDLAEDRQIGLGFPAGSGRIGMVSVTLPVVKGKVRVVVIGGFGRFKGLDFTAATALSDAYTLDTPTSGAAAISWQERTNGPQPIARGFAVGRQAS